MEQELSCGIFGDLLGYGGAVQYDLRQHGIRPAAYPEIQIALDLSGDNVGVRPLGCEDQMHPEGPALPRDYRQPAFDLAGLFLLLLGKPGFVQHLRCLVTGEDISLQALFSVPVIFVQIGAAVFSEQLLSPPLKSAIQTTTPFFSACMSSSFSNTLLPLLVEPPAGYGGFLPNLP